jgi:phage shock protein A
VSSSPEAIRSAYAAAIDEAKRRYKELERVVALLAGEREKTEMAAKELEKQRFELEKKLEGALAQAEADQNNSAHRDAGTRYISLIEEVDRKRTKLKEDLDFQKNKVEEYKLKLRTTTSEIEKLKREQNEMVAEYVSNRQLLQMEDRLRGLSLNGVDAALVAVRERVASMREHAKTASEMRGATLEGQDEVYARIGDEKQAAARFDELLKARSEAKSGVHTKDRDLG